MLRVSVIAVALLLGGCAMGPRPAADAGTSAGVFSCAEAAQMRSLVSTQPVAGVFANKSGGDIQLFWLGYDGKQVSYGTVPAGQSKAVVTFATHPWLIEDSAGQCIKIVRLRPETQVAAVTAGDVTLAGTLEAVASRH